MTMSGGCLCGAVRYTIEGEPAFAGKCYCTDCQKESGAGHLTIMSVPDSAVTITGETKSFVKTGDSGKQVVRIFCPSCGTTVLGRPEVMAGISMIRAGTLDDSSCVDVGLAVFGASAPHWDRPPDGMQLFAGMPPLA